MARVRGAVVVCVAAVLSSSGCAGGADGPAATGAGRPGLEAEIVQLRRDEVLERVEVALHNVGETPVVVDRLRLRVPGFGPVAAQAKDSPVPPGRVVNLPTPYGEVRCPAGQAPRVGPARVVLRVHDGAGGPLRRVVVRARDPRGLIARIAERSCALARLGRQVQVRFGPGWRVRSGPDGVTADGTLTVRLLDGATHRVTQVAGTVIYDLSPRPARAGALAQVSPQRPEASVGVRFRSARCTGHAIGEVKKPYAFLVWVTDDTGAELALTPPVDPATVTALQQVCRL